MRIALKALYEMEGCMLMLNNLLGDRLLSAYAAKLHIN